MSAAPAPAVPLPAPGGPRRRFPEPAPAPISMPAEPERALAAGVPAPAISDLADEPLGIGAGDVAPRRRRRRGGRGRRSGLGGLGDGDAQNETLHDAIDDADELDGEDEEERSPALATGATGSSPDDIDTAVLQLLASRDREQSPPPAADTASEADQPAVLPATAETGTVTAPAEPERHAPRRVVRTSFSSFGPPESNFRPRTPAPIRSEPLTPVASAPESLGTGELASPADAPAPAVTDGTEAAAADDAASEPIGAESTVPDPIASAIVSDA